jgi:hypothetical protein
MASLRLTTADGQVATFELLPGVNSLGRDSSNRVVIEHPTISGFHCELTVEGAAVLVRDLGSTNGTFIERQRIQEGYLQPGQALQVGAVAMRYAATPVGAAPPGPLTPQPLVAQPSPPTAPARGCRNHPDLPGELICTQCRQLFCPACVLSRPVSGRLWRLCPICKGECRPLTDHLAEQTARKTHEGLTFFQRLPGVFAYPFARGGVMLLVGGTVLFGLMGLAGRVARYAGPFGLGSALILFVFCVGYLFAFMQRIVLTSAQGEDTLPSWPEFTEWGSDIIRPFLMLIWTLVLCFGAPLAYEGFSLFSGEEIIPVVRYTALAAGFLYFPMALLAVAISDSFGALNPVVVVPAIARAPLQYLVASAMFFAVVALRYAGEVFLPAIVPIPLVPSLLAGFVALYCLTVEMRILGLLYFTNRKRFGWFE